MLDGSCLSCRRSMFSHINLDSLFRCGRWGALLWARWIAAWARCCTCENVVSNVDFFGERPWHVLTTINGPLLLSRLSLLIFFLFIWRVLPIIISHVDLVSELNSKRAPFDPGCFRFQRHRTWRHVIKNVIVDAGNHIRWLYKRETE